MAATEVTSLEKKPFHESILDTIKNLESIEELELVEALLVATKIPKGHDEIIAALTEKMEEVSHEPIKAGVLASILKEKELAQVAVTEKGKGLKTAPQPKAKQTRGPSFSKPAPSRAFSGF